MTIEYNVSQDGTRINTFPKGVLDIKETIDYFNRIKRDTKIKPGAVELVDFTDVTDFKISYVESKKITQTYQEPKNSLMIDKTIFVVIPLHDQNEIYLTALSLSSSQIFVYFLLRQLSY